MGDRLAGFLFHPHVSCLMQALSFNRVTSWTLLFVLAHCSDYEAGIIKDVALTTKWKGKVVNHMVYRLIDYLYKTSLSHLLEATD